MTIPLIDVATLFGPASDARAVADAAIRKAATGIGFMLIQGTPPAPGNEALLRAFDLPAAASRQLWRAKFKPDQPNNYRGWFPLQDGYPTYKEGYDLGPDVAHGPGRVNAADPLCEATPLPPEHLLPGWRADMASYYKAMEQVGETLLRSVARSLDLPENTFVPAFAGGISTLRLLHYPVRPAASYVGVHADQIRTAHAGRMVDLVGAAHVDSGFVTLLAQHGVSGLQALGPGEEWIDVPPLPGTLVVNFGKLLERWTGNRIKATRHRVIGSKEVARYSVPFFYEPRVDARIAPLAGLGGGFEPFFYGDHLWSAMTKFVEFEGLEHLREKRRKTAS